MALSLPPPHPTAVAPTPCRCRVGARRAGVDPSLAAIGVSAAFMGRVCLPPSPPFCLPHLPGRHRRQHGPRAGTDALLHRGGAPMEFASAPTVMRWVVAAAVAMVSLLPAAAAMPTPTATSTPAAAPCPRRLYFHPNEFERCRRGTTCFFFLAEEPFIRLDAAIDADHRGTDLDPRRLFPCLDYAKRGLSGIGFKLYEQLVPSETDLCVLADPQDGCTFKKVMEALRNSTVDPSHPGYGMGLGASGAWVSTEWRADKAVASAPYMEVRLVGRGGGIRALVALRGGVRTTRRGEPAASQTASKPHVHSKRGSSVRSSACGD